MIYSKERDRKASKNSLPTARDFLKAMGYENIIEHKDNFVTNEFWDTEATKNGIITRFGVQEKTVLEEKVFPFTTVDVECRKRKRDKPPELSVRLHILTSPKRDRVIWIQHRQVKSCPIDSMYAKPCNIPGLSGKWIDTFVPIPNECVRFYRKDGDKWVVDEINDKFDPNHEVDWDTSNTEGEWPVEDLERLRIQARMLSNRTGYPILED